MKDVNFSPLKTDFLQYTLYIFFHFLPPTAHVRSPLTTQFSAVLGSNCVYLLNKNYVHFMK